ncbi:MAG: hypothetical protein RBR68_07530 [Tenuifilaceae bacterium]|nr:hypothetical protein [Tenuifilaceae bacterium]
MDIRQMCDGFDVSTAVGTLHFTRKPSEDDLAIAVEQITMAAGTMIEEIVAEDGTVLNGEVI